MTAQQPVRTRQINAGYFDSEDLRTFAVSSLPVPLEDSGRFRSRAPLRHYAEAIVNEQSKFRRCMRVGVALPRQIQCALVS